MVFSFFVTLSRLFQHCIAAWMEIEAEDRAEMEKIGTPVPVIEKKLLDARRDWVSETTRAWELAQPKKEAVPEKI